MQNNYSYSTKENPIIGDTIYYPTNDYCFKRLFGHKGNEEITQGLIEAILGYKCDVVDIKSDEVTEQDLVGDKVGVLDVFVKQKDGTRINLEMQMVSYETIIKRVLFYWAKKYIESIKSGETYESLEPTKVILITNFEIKELNTFKDTVSSFKIIEEIEKKVILTEDLEIVIIELPKIKKLGTKRQEAKNWIEFIKNPYSLGGDVLGKNKTLNKAKKEYDKIVADEHERTLIRLREKYMLDYNTLKEESLKRGVREGLEQGMKEGLEQGIKEGLETGKKQGLEQGIKEGLEAGKEQELIKIVQNMLKEGLDISTISKVTGLSKQKITKLEQLKQP